VLDSARLAGPKVVRSGAAALGARELVHEVIDEATARARPGAPRSSCSPRTTTTSARYKSTRARRRHNPSHRRQSRYRDADTTSWLAWNRRVISIVRVPADGFPPPASSLMHSAGRTDGGHGLTSVGRRTRRADVLDHIWKAHLDGLFACQGDGTYSERVGNSSFGTRKDCVSAGSEAVGRIGRARQANR